MTTCHPLTMLFLVGSVASEWRFDVAGTVVDSAGHPAINATVVLIDNQPRAMVPGLAPSLPRLGPLPPREWWFTAETPGHKGEMTKLDLSKDSVEGVDFQLRDAGG